MADARENALRTPARLWLRAAAARLAAGGIENAPREARLLLAVETGLGPLDLIRDPEASLTAESECRLDAMLARRLAREPVSRISGEREFYGRSFQVTPATLDPRPDTETLIEAALEVAVQEGLTGRHCRLLDIGTGSGCIAITLLAELPQAMAVATDRSSAAIAVAGANARRHGLAERLQLVCTDLTEGIEGPFDIIVSNPPYIPSSAIAELEPEVRCFDPPDALDGGGDGLDFYRRIARCAPLAAPDAWVLVEVGAGQAGAVEAILPGGFCPRQNPVPRRWKDLGGHTRVVAFRTHR